MRSSPITERKCSRPIRRIKGHKTDQSGKGGARRSAADARPPQPNAEKDYKTNGREKFGNFEIVTL